MKGKYNVVWYAIIAVCITILILSVFKQCDKTANDYEKYIHVRETIVRDSAFTLIDSAKKVIRNLEISQAIKDSAYKKEIERLTQAAEKARTKVEFLILENPSLDTLIVLKDSTIHIQQQWISEKDTVIERYKKSIASLDAEYKTIADRLIRTTSELGYSNERLNEDLTAEQDKDFGIGPSIGYGLTPSGPQPYFGISVHYNLLKFNIQRRKKK